MTRPDKPSTGRVAQDRRQTRDTRATSGARQPCASAPAMTDLEVGAAEKADDAHHAREAEHFERRPRWVWAGCS